MNQPSSYNSPRNPVSASRSEGSSLRTISSALIRSIGIVTLKAPRHSPWRLRKGTAIPQNNPLNPKYRALVALWRRLPRPLVNALGPMLTRNLG